MFVDIRAVGGLGVLGGHSRMVGFALMASLAVTPPPRHGMEVIGLYHWLEDLFFCFFLHKN